MVVMYTGARAEELASLKTDHIDLTRRSIDMAGTKMEAAPREVPIHLKLVPVFRRLAKNADKDGYLFCFAASSPTNSTTGSATTGIE